MSENQPPTTTLQNAQSYAEMDCFNDAFLGAIHLWESSITIRTTSQCTQRAGMENNTTITCKTFGKDAERRTLDLNRSIMDGCSISTYYPSFHKVNDISMGSTIQQQLFRIIGRILNENRIGFAMGSINGVCNNLWVGFTIYQFTNGKRKLMCTFKDSKCDYFSDGFPWSQQSRAQQHLNALNARGWKTTRRSHAKRSEKMLKDEELHAGFEQMES